MGRDVLSSPNINKRQGLFRPFGHGRKGCVGHILAFVEMRTIMTCWLTTFQLCRGPLDPKELCVSDKTLETLPVKWEVANQPTEKVIKGLRKNLKILLFNACLKILDIRLSMDNFQECLNTPLWQESACTPQGSCKCLI
jgi:hypothetical protein